MPTTTNVEGGERATVTIPGNTGIRGPITAVENLKEKQKRSRSIPLITLAHMTWQSSTNP
jgi:hypothetical protein